MNVGDLMAKSFDWKEFIGIALGVFILTGAFILKNILDKNG